MINKEVFFNYSMYIEENEGEWKLKHSWPIANILKIQIFIYHPILSNNCNNVFPPVLLLCSVTPGAVLEEEQQYTV